MSRGFRITLTRYFSAGFFGRIIYSLVAMLGILVGEFPIQISVARQQPQCSLFSFLNINNNKKTGSVRSMRKPKKLLFFSILA